MTKARPPFTANPENIPCIQYTRLCAHTFTARLSRSLRVGYRRAGLYRASAGAENSAR
jgi:hypothetical protein